MTDYARADLIGPAETLTLEPADSELLVDSLDELLDILDDDLRVTDDDAAADGIRAQITELAGLRDSLHSVLTDPAP